MPFRIILPLIHHMRSQEDVQKETILRHNCLVLCVFACLTSFPTSYSPFLSPVSISRHVFFLSFQHSYCSLFYHAVGGWWVFGVMIAWHVVSQLWVIRSNIISKAINGRQYSCVFYSFFHSSLNILTSLLFIHTGSSLITFRENVTGRDGENK